jgi:hypothetical protein
MKKVIIKKLQPAADAKYPTAGKTGYIPGQDNGPVSVPVEYEVEGIIDDEAPKIGECLSMLRYRRNGVVTPGYFTTSKITNVDGNVFTTTNSVYEITYIE